MAEHKFSKRAKPTKGGSITDEQARMMKIVSNLCIVLLERLGGEATATIAEIDRDGRAVAMKYDAEKQVWHFKIELLT